MKGQAESRVRLFCVLLTLQGIGWFLAYLVLRAIAQRIIDALF